MGVKSGIAYQFKCSSKLVGTSEVLRGNDVPQVPTVKTIKSPGREVFEEWIAWSTLIWFVGRIAGKQKRQRDPGSGKIRGFSQMTALLATRLGNSLERWFRKKID